MEPHTRMASYSRNTIGTIEINDHCFGPKVCEDINFSPVFFSLLVVMASKPLCLEVVWSNLGNPSELFPLVRANEGYEWEMMEQVNAGFFMEMLQNNRKLIEFLDVSDACTLARTNSHVADCTLWVFLMHGLPDVALQLPILTSLRGHRALEREVQRQSMFTTMIQQSRHPFIHEFLHSLFLIF